MIAGQFVWQEVLANKTFRSQKSRRNALEQLHFQESMNMKSQFFQLLSLVLLSVLLTIPAHGKEPTSRSQTKEFTVQKKFLVMPIASSKAPKSNLSLFIDDVKVRGVGVHLASSKETTGWYAIFTIDQYKGKTAKVTVSSASDETFDLIRQSDVIPDEEKLFKEPWRPQFHYTQRVGWVNDPNGMVYHDGTWHFFYQHNPVSRGWGNMTWGHATTKDLLHWEHQGNKLYNGISTKGPIFSGGGTVDKQNTAGFGENAIIL